MVRVSPLSYIRKIFSNIKLFFLSNSKKIKNLIIATILFTIIILNSGYTLTYISEDTFFKTLISLISFAVIFLIYIFTVNFSDFISLLKKKSPPISFIIVILVGISALITMFYCKEINELTTYISFGIQILAAYLLARLFSFKRFISYYQNVIFVISIITIIFSGLTLISGMPFSPLKEFKAVNGAVYENYFYICFDHLGLKRAQGPFWEPGLFSSFLILALSFELIFYKKVRIPYVVVFLGATLLTMSTFGYLILLLVFVLFLYKKVENFKLFTFLLLATCAFVIALFVFSDKIIPPLAKMFPTVFGKMVDQQGNIRFLDVSRLNSPIFNLQIWLRNPIFGNGIIGANKIFTETYSGLCQTSTNTLYMAEFGIFGLIFTVALIMAIFKINGISVVEKVILFIIFILILNKEPHNGIWFDWLFIFLCIKEFIDMNKVSLAFDTPSEKSIIKSFHKTDDESVVKSNITLSYLIKGLALLIGFFSYPVYQNYFSNEAALGVWLTVLSLMNIALTFDFGLGNGLKNKLIKALVNDDKGKQKSLISSTYVCTSILSIIILNIVTPLIFTLDMNAFLGVSIDVIDPFVLKLSAFLVILSISLELTLRNVCSLLQAKQKQALSSLFGLLSTLLLMIFALCYKSGDPNSLLLSISIAYIITINLPLLLGTVYAFLKYYKGSFISFKSIDKDSLKSVLNLGLGFFIVQLLLLVLTGTNETIISNIFGSSATVLFTDYNKPFMVIYSLFSIVTLPMWAMIAKEKEEQRFDLVKKNFKKCLLFLLVFLIACLMLAILFQPFINLWLGNNAINVNYFIVFSYVLFIFELTACAALVVITNGFSVIKEQIIFFGIAALIKIVLCIILKNVDIPNKNWSFVVYINVIALVPLLIGLLFTVIKIFRKMPKENLPNEN